MTKIICVAGFGDDASMFAPLVEATTSLAVQLFPVSLPGFGTMARAGQQTSLQSLATALVDLANSIGAETVLAHSVSSIIASIAATRQTTPIKSILSLEGNLTPEDAYFSGTAANYNSAEAFRPAFLAQLNEMAEADPIMARYRNVVERADPTALWELGCDAQHFSTIQIPGDFLCAAAKAVYLFNPKNVPAASMDWLAAHDLPRLELPCASHWASIDQPELLAAKMGQALEMLS